MKIPFSLLVLFLTCNFSIHLIQAQTWVGSSGPWNTASNWSPATVPNSPTAIVTINTNSEITITSAVTVGSISIGASSSPSLILQATLTVQNTATIGANAQVKFNGGNLGGSGTWTFSGELSIDQPVTINGNVAIIGSGLKYLNRPLTISQGATLTLGGTGDWELGDAGMVDNKGTVDFIGGFNIYSYIGTADFLNFGLITCNAPTGAPTFIDLDVVNTGIIRAQTGHCSFTSASGGGPNTGLWEAVASNAKIFFSSQAGLGTFTFAGTSRFRTSNDGQIELNSGTLSVTDGQPQIEGLFVMAGGQLITPNGAWLVAPNGTVRVTQEMTFNEVQFINQGLFEVTASDGVYFNAPSTFINRAPGVIDFKSDTGFFNYIGQSFLRNEVGATINCNAPTGARSTINTALHNNGTVQTVSGICELTAGAEPSAGLFKADGRNLIIDGQFNLIQGATLTGVNGGLVLLDGAVLASSAGQVPQFSGDITCRECELKDGPFLIDETCRFVVELATGSKSFTSAAVENRGEILLSEGTVVTSSSTIDNYGNLTVVSGGISGTGRLINRPEGNIFTDGVPVGVSASVGVTVENYGRVAHNKGTIQLGRFVNENGGEFVINGGTVSAFEVALNGGVVTYVAGTLQAGVRNTAGLLKIGADDSVTTLRVSSYTQDGAQARLEIHVDSLQSFDRLQVDGAVDITAGSLLLDSQITLPANSTLTRVISYTSASNTDFSGHDENGCNKAAGFQTQARQSQIDVFIGCEVLSSPDLASGASPRILFVALVSLAISWLLLL